MLDAAKPVDPSHPEEEQERQQDHHIPKHRHPRCDSRPRISVVEHWRDERCKKHEKDQRHDDLLRQLSLMLRPSLHPALEERSIVNRQVHCETCGRRGKDPHEQPALPVVQRAGRPDDKDNEEEGPEHSLNNCLSVHRIHINATNITSFKASVPVERCRKAGGDPRYRSRSVTCGSTRSARRVGT